MNKSNELSELIRQADVQARDKAMPVAQGKRKSFPMTNIFGAVLLMIIAYSVVKISAAFTPPSEEKVAHDLERAVTDAQQSVDGFKMDTGKLPDAIPNPALAAVVQYKKRDTDYRLSATIMGVRVTLESAGKMTTETGVK